MELICLLEGNMDIKMIQKHITTNMSEMIREDKVDGKECFVVPVILIAEGVHNSIYYPAEELAKFPTAWDGIPISIDHPSMQGQGVTANSPELESKNVGRIYNTQFEDGKLKSEAWLIKDKIISIESVMVKLHANEMIEVSTGLFVEEELVAGKWKGEEYIGIARNYRPDHLALLT